MKHICQKWRLRLSLIILALSLYSSSWVSAAAEEIGREERDGTRNFWGLVLPGESDDTFRLRGRFGTLTIKLKDDTFLGYNCFRSLNMEKRRIRPVFFNFSIPGLGERNVEKKLPQDLYVRKTYHPSGTAAEAFTNDLTNRKLQFIDGVFATPLGLHHPTAQEPWFSAKIAGLVNPQARHRNYYAMVNGQRIEFGLGVYPYVWGIIERDEIEPYGTEAEVFGTRKGGIVIAERVAINPIGDPIKYEKPDLPRYLFIGDSISIGYNGELRRLLEGKVNLYHPHTNCGPSGKGVGRVDAWLGAHEEPGRGWDAISFNFGHWDAGNSKEAYQQNLETVIEKLKNTGAELIYVTTTPVDKGYPPAGKLLDKGSKGMCAPGRTHGVMEKYINPWALEVMRRHPEIAICDQWQIVKDGENGLYKEWWHGKNVHFARHELNTPLAQALADKVMEALKKREMKAKAGQLPKPASPRNVWESEQ